MRNVLAIARKEVRGYFVSPIGWVILGLFAVLFGFFYYAFLGLFVRQSLQMNQFGGGPQSMNVNLYMIRPLLQNTSVIILFVLPMVTMRTYAEEKRSGTIELLMTSPVTDLQIILGKFFGALTLYASMLLVTAVYIGMLFRFGDPEVGPILSGYLGLLLLGGGFIAVGLLVSSLTKNQIVAAMATFGTFLMLWVIGWVGDFAGPTTRSIVSYLSITEHFDDFSKGVIDTKHLVYYLSFITFGLFLTAKAVDSERWRG
jgi:ABC-2 type transport system permease protein